MATLTSPPGISYPRTIFLKYLGSLVHPQNFANNVPEDPLRIEPLPDSLEPSKMLHLSVTWPTKLTQTGPLTFGSKFLTDRANTSRVFLVQCGRHGNSSMSVLATLWS